MTSMPPVTGSRAEIEHNVLYRQIRLPITPDPRTSAEMACALAALRHAIEAYLERDTENMPEGTKGSLGSACAEIDNVITALACRAEVGFS